MSRAALAGAVAVAAAAALALALACGDSDEPAKERGGFGRLVWSSPPTVFTPRRLPDDRILVGRLKNDSLRQVELRAAEDVELLDRAGRPIQHTVVFSQSFGRDIYPPRFGARPPEEDQLRLGLRAKLEPGATRPITVAWRERKRARRAVRLELPGGTLRVPPTSARTGG